MSNLEVRKEFICLPQIAVDTTCARDTCFFVPCGLNPCTCFLGFCIVWPLIISNADFEVTEENGEITLLPRPSEFLQYSILHTPCTNILEVKIFRFPGIPNEHKDRVLVQSRNESGILECKELFFADKDKCKNNCH